LHAVIEHPPLRIARSLNSSRRFGCSTAERFDNLNFDIVSDFDIRYSEFKLEVFFMECQKEQNLKNCNCSYPGCERKGTCCECLSYHLSSKQLPGCCFPDEVEKSYDRSFTAFAKAWGL